MTVRLTENERNILRVLQQGLPTTLTPYQDVAREAGVGTEEVLELLKKWRNEGVLRRIGAIVNHFKVGVDAGAMVVWRVPSDRLQQTGRLLAGFEQVSHAYERVTTKHWPYNLYTMVHGVTDEEVRRTVERMAQAAGVSDFKLLQTERELKKVPPTYITQ